MDAGPGTPLVASDRRSDRTVTPTVLGGFALAMLLVLASGVTTVYELRSAFRAGDSSRDALGTVAQAGRLRDVLGAAENAQRAYLLTGDGTHLHDYEQDVAAIDKEIAGLRTLAEGDPARADRLAALAPLLTTKIDELARAVDLRRAGDQDGVVASIAAGKQVDERIAGLLGEIEAQASQRIDAHLASRTARRERAEWMIAATAGGAALALALSLMLLARSTAAYRYAEGGVRDTEERLRAALSTRLVASETRARAVLDTTLSAIVSIDDRGRIETFNQAAERLFGYTADEIRGRNVALLMPQPYRGEHDGYVRRYLETGERRIIGIDREVTGLRKDGTLFPMTLAVSDILIDGNHVFTGVITDLTREKEVEHRERQLLKQAARNERLADLGAMTARIAHDFGNPLAGLHMAAQRIRRLLAREPVAIDKVRDAVDLIVATSRRLDVLVGEFKEFAREQRLELHDIDLPVFLQQVATTWKVEADARGIALELDIADAPPTIRGDEQKLRRVMDNLMKNALEAVDHGPGFVRLRAEPQGSERVRILVADSGTGIPQGVDVFALFETTKANGTGLGLPICRQIVLAHGGGIEYAARHPSGTTFSVQLPTHDPAQGL
jgi:two-component system sensor kinase FixL